MELENQEISKGRSTLPRSVARSILRTAFGKPDTDIKFLRAMLAVLVSYVFFVRGEAGALLLLPNFRIWPDTIDIAIALR